MCNALDSTSILFTYLNDLKTIGFINNFGQTPKQLFRKPHPAKRWVVGSASMTAVDHADNSSTHTTVSTSDGSATYSKLFFHNLTNLRPSVAPIKELKGPVGQIQHIDRVVLAVEQVLLHYIFQTIRGQPTASVRSCEYSINVWQKSIT